jgi:hypothetical protein
MSFKTRDTRLFVADFRMVTMAIITMPISAHKTDCGATAGQRWATFLASL